MADKSSYRHIVKSTGIFGGVQVVQIVANIVRGKIAAILLGAAGMGVSSLLISSTAMLQAMSGLGLSYSAVREISKAQETGDNYRLSRVFTVLFQWLIFSALFGALILIVISPFLSTYAFGNREYTWEFVWLSIVVALNTLGAGYQTLIQGTRRLKYLAKSSVIGSLLSICTSFPIYYFWGIRGIVPALILVAFTTYALNYYFARKITLETIHIGVKETVKEGGEMVKLGLAMMITGMINTLFTFLIIAYIKKNGSLSDVGLYQAGLSVTGTSVGLVFSAMGVDYFPRLSAICADDVKVRNMANQQSEIMLLIATPFVITMIIAAPLIVRVLLSREFLPIISFIRLYSIGMLFQAANYSMGLISYAKGDRKTFIALAIAGNCLLILSTVIGYALRGLDGVAGMFIVHSVICFFMVYITAYKRYKYWMSWSFSKFLLLGVIMVVLICSLVMLAPVVIGYSLSVMLLGITIAYSIYKLDTLIGVKETWSGFISRFQKK